MKTKELKQGNWIAYENCHFQVVGFDTDQVLLSFAWVYLKSINPIPINEEWLLKFGFVQASEFKQHYLLECEFGVYEYAFFDSSKSLWINETFIPNIKYIHQLQNLYFALTQTELDIK